MFHFSSLFSLRNPLFSQMWHPVFIWNMLLFSLNFFLTLDNFYSIELQFQYFLHYGLIFLNMVHRAVAGFLDVFLSSVYHHYRLQQARALITAHSLPYVFSKHDFLTLFHFRNTYLLVVHPIPLCYEEDILYNSDLLSASLYFYDLLSASLYLFTCIFTKFSVIDK